jgi:hypothetical protein
MIMKKVCEWCGDHMIGHKFKMCSECRFMKFKAKQKRRFRNLSPKEKKL